jgi:hypothetical protein
MERLKPHPEKSSPIGIEPRLYLGSGEGNNLSRNRMTLSKNCSFVRHLLRRNALNPIPPRLPGFTKDENSRGSKS